MVCRPGSVDRWMGIDGKAAIVQREDSIRLQRIAQSQFLRPAHRASAKHRVLIRLTLHDDHIRMEPQSSNDAPAQPVTYVGATQHPLVWCNDIDRHRCNVITCDIVDLVTRCDRRRVDDHQ